MGEPGLCLLVATQRAPASLGSRTSLGSGSIRGEGGLILLTHGNSVYYVGILFLNQREDSQVGPEKRFYGFFVQLASHYGKEPSCLCDAGPVDSWKRTTFQRDRMSARRCMPAAPPQPLGLTSAHDSVPSFQPVPSTQTCTAS